MLRIMSWNNLQKNITENISVEKTYSIRKVGGGSGLRKKKSECWSLFHIPPPPCPGVALRKTTYEKEQAYSSTPFKELLRDPPEHKQMIK